MEPADPHQPADRDAASEAAEATSLRFSIEVHAAIEILLTTHRPKPEHIDDLVAACVISERSSTPRRASGT